MKTLAHKDLGIKSDVVTVGKTDDQVVEKVWKYLNEFHPYEMQMLSKYLDDERIKEEIAHKIKDENWRWPFNGNY